MPEPLSNAIAMPGGDLDALLSRLELIEDQPLANRSPAFVQLYDELRAALEGSDTSA